MHVKLRLTWTDLFPVWKEVKINVPGWLIVFIVFLLVTALRYVFYCLIPNSEINLPLQLKNIYFPLLL